MPIPTAKGMILPNAMAGRCEHGYRPGQCVQCETKRRGREITGRDEEIQRLKGRVAELETGIKYALKRYGNYKSARLEAELCVLLESGKG